MFPVPLPELLAAGGPGSSRRSPFSSRIRGLKGLRTGRVCLWCCLSCRVSRVRMPRAACTGRCSDRGSRLLSRKKILNAGHRPATLGGMSDQKSPMLGSFSATIEPKTAPRTNSMAVHDQPWVYLVPGSSRDPGTPGCPVRVYPARDKPREAHPRSPGTGSVLGLGPQGV